MSSEDIRYARRSDIGEVSASAELLGRLATVDWIELMVALTENKSWYVRELGLSRHHRCGCNFSASSIMQQCSSGWRLRRSSNLESEIEAAKRHGMLVYPAGSG
jgi:hypothetical protein